ncbi:hypothetical protein [Spirosoma rhododendri]|uniref:Uncharacterized protein n=1 Tax=Spirosoma rhododendri TaxID=2728024 RepID=A0A7L5DQB1_9BACT|nr:hypothetical protein [Spirosoma rhododendri]QJD79403.1 hypothetical protein HH216_14025 [Spirosoma rhododendri]
MTHTITFRLCQLVGLLSLLTACAPSVTTTTTYRLRPVSGDVTTLDGKPVTRAENNGVAVVASFEREEADLVALDVEIKNLSDHAIEVNPADFRLVALGEARDTLTDPANDGLPLIRQAADPSYESGRVDLARKVEEKRLKRAKILNTVLMVAAIASDVSSSSRSRSYGEYVNNRISHNVAYQAIAVKRAINYGNFANRMQRLDYEDYRWRELALHAQTLQPTETIRGLVYLPKLTAARYLSINYTIPEQASVPLLFEQQQGTQTVSTRRRGR